ncbi:MAG: hypothetical protein ACK4PG_08635 [Acetobacteraceae bacterium]
MNAQERGEVARADGSVNQHTREGVRSADTRPATLTDLGIPRQRAAEMKKLAEAGERRIRDEVNTATREGRRA